VKRVLARVGRWLLIAFEGVGRGFAGIYEIPYRPDREHSDDPTR
jgi:hypothetical protein